MKKKVGACLAIGFFLLALWGVVLGQSREASVSTESNPGRMLALSSGGGIKQSFHHPTRADCPQDAILPRKELTDIEWQTMWYPDAIGQRVELCYFAPYASNSVDCILVSPNSSGNISSFNGQLFDIDSNVELVYEADSATGTLSRQIENAVMIV
ncbi:hypothetical protein [Billgrantia endophytica]|uniref:hypothetical protein n=1 Tax=Billgrantia endophytica TaxID=2033802 RepID=UPI001054C376|nr:hypothetical protein [Halomonas endophytica]